MKRTTLPSLLALAILATAAGACGDDAVDPGSNPSTLPDVPLTVPTSDAPAGYQHPTGADEVVFEYAELGGFVPREYAFQATPSILISGDGRVFTPGPQIEIYPGPLLPNILVRSITERGIQQVLAAADAAGLLANVDYSGEVGVADAPTATVTITVDGQTWVHEAYALGLADPTGVGDESSPERQALADFLDALQGGELIDAAELGVEASFVPEQYLIETLVVDDLAAYGSDIEPTVVDWPATAGISLANAATCVAVPAAAIGETLQAANQLTFFQQSETIYQVNAKPALPGSSCQT